MSSPVNPLAGVAPVLRTFRTRVEQGNTTLRGLTDKIRTAAASTDRIRTAAAQGATTLRQVRTNAEAATRSVTKAGRSASTAATGVKSVGTRAKGVTTALKKLKSKLGGVIALIGGFIGVVGILGDLMGAFGMAMTIGAGVMMVINLLTRANPIGFVTGLLLPVAGRLLDLALNSQAGQRFMKQAATVVLKYVRGYLAVIGPVLKIVGKVVSAYFKGYLALITGVIKGIGAVIGIAFAVLRALTTGDTRALRGKVSAVWRGFKNAVKPALTWITREIPKMFKRVRDAMSRTLGGLGKFVTTGAQTVAGVVKGPINGLIAFANWVIDGLNSLSVSVFGKKFGVDIDKIPMLAEGGVAVPGVARRAGRVLPLTALERQRALNRRRAARLQRPYRVAEFHESEGAGARGTAEDLLFLTSAYACT
ncbi:tape-measure protein [Streptomyces sp. NPDC002845]